MGHVQVSGGMSSNTSKHTGMALGNVRPGKCCYTRLRAKNPQFTKSRSTMDDQTSCMGEYTTQNVQRAYNLSCCDSVFAAKKTGTGKPIAATAPPQGEDRLLFNMLLVAHLVKC